MKNFFIFLIAFALLGPVISKAQSKNITYLSPKPNSVNNTLYENLIIFANTDINSSSLSNSLIEVNGSVSGSHSGQIKLSPDGKTILFEPALPFAYSETVTVNVNPGILTQGGEHINPVNFSFTTRDSTPTKHDGNLHRLRNELMEKGEKNTLREYTFSDAFQGNTVPEGFPRITVLDSTNPSSGKIFMASIDFRVFQGSSSTNAGNSFAPDGPTKPYIIIAENSGEPFFYKEEQVFALDFKMLPNGNLCYFSTPRHKYLIMDTSYTVIDSFDFGNGYPIDHHEFELTPDKHVLLMSYDEIYVDMSQIIPGGLTDAKVTGLIIQELDKDKNVVFQWRSWDHFQVTDATQENLTISGIDYVHGNAIEMDYDGNILISSRHMDEITKINRVSGEIMWRLGGKNNEFTFINDDRGFSHQHDIRRVAPGRITLFDNGNFHNEQYSRAVEYELDEINKTATLVWEYDHNKQVYGFAMGNVQRLPNGNTFIGWGTGRPTMTEVDPDGNIVFEMTLPDSVWNYRAYRFTFKQDNNSIIPENFSLSQNYPNPFNPSTEINFDVPNNSFVTLKIYDTLGREVASLVNQNVNAGSYSVLWDAQNLSSGVYFYTLASDNFSTSKKMVLLR